jgi:integrase/recombinase XerD
MDTKGISMSTKAPSITLKRKIKVNGTWTFVPVAQKNGKYLHDVVLISGVPMKVAEGTFYLDWREGGKRIQKSVGANGHEAIEAHRVQTATHEGRAAGVHIEHDAPQLERGRIPMKQQVSQFFEDHRLRPKSVSKYREALTSFQSFTAKRYIDELKPDDIRRYLSHLTGTENLAPKTAKVKGRIVHGVLTSLGAVLPMKRGDWPKATKKQRRPMYATDTIQSLLSTVSREHFIMWSFFLHTGFREQEVAFCSWGDVDFKRGEISVTEKSHLGFEIKNYQQRTVPVPDEMMILLREHKATLPAGSSLVFPTKAARGDAGKIKQGGKNRLNMLDLLKLDYYLAGLNCGQCQVISQGKKTTCSKVPQCKKVGLHMFRHTFASNHLRAGFNIVDVSTLLGHADVATTLIYLHDLGKDELRTQLQTTNLGSLYTPDKFERVERKRIHVVSDESRKRMSEGGKASALLKATGTK